jgi:ABC-type nickel/cobalt efflux system permease component RcnA
MNARAIITILLTAWIMIVPNSATAHPLGNFSISHYSGIRVSKDAIELRYMIDMAEIPTFQEIQESGIEPKAGDPSLEAYLARKAEILRDGLALEVNGKPLVLRAESREIIFPPGAGGLPTMKVGFLYKAKLIGDSNGAEYLLTYRDGNFPGRAGWKEIIAVAAPGAEILNSSVPEVDRSSQLNNYPTDLLNSPPQELEARVAFTTAAVPAPLAAVGASVPRLEKVEQTKADDRLQTTPSHGSLSSKEIPTSQDSIEAKGTPSPIDAELPPTTESGPVQLQANRQATPRNSFTELIATKQLGIGIVLIALAVAVGLGGFHALEPGHGKTLVTAYLVGSRGTMKHAFLLGLIVTATHTAGVYLLGAVTLYASRYIVPERLYPWLGVVSGVMIAGLGAVLLVRRYLGKDGLSNHHHHHHRDHSHGPDDHDHHHHHRHEHGHSHDLGHMHRDHDLDRQVSLRELLTLGISGGIVPCPAALVVLLSAVSMQRIGFGLLLIVAFSVGLAAILITIGLLMVSARQFMSRFQVNSRLTTRWLPLTSSAFILVFGVALAVQALQTAGILFIQL